MRKAKVKFKGEYAGTLIQEDGGNFIFHYDKNWFDDQRKPAISLTLPKSEQPYASANLFPFFFHMLPEGVNKQLICKLMKIDPDDSFGLLLNTASYDSIGAITVEQI